MNGRIKILAGIAMVFVLASVVPAFASAETYTNTNQTVLQTQWRANLAPFGTLSGSYDDSGPYYTYTATGNSIHEMFEYEPAVTNQQGGNHSYTFDKSNGDYIMHSGVISYTSPYTGLTVYEVWNGTISFNGARISSSNLAVTTGQLDQWGFVYSPGAAPSLYPYAVDMGSGYWLVGFSTYTYGSTPAPSGALFFSLALSPTHLP